MSRYSDDQRRRNQSSSSLWFFNNVDKKQNKVVAEEGKTHHSQQLSSEMIISAPDAIDIADIDLKIQDNGLAHQTYKYELMAEENALVLRRGSPFNIVVTFSHENYIPKDDNMKLVFHTGKEDGQHE